MLMNPLSKRARLVTALTASAIAFSLAGCESPLSDIELTDPGTLITTFAVERSMLDDGTVLTSLQATLLDKNLASVELKNGHVKVNGQEMSEAEILNISTYYIPSATVNLSTDYNFEVVLPNGQSYSGTVTTPEKTFTSVTAPATSTAGSDLTISWQDAYVFDEFIISLGLTSPSGIVAGTTFSLTPEQMEAGSFVIPKSSFATPAGITSVTVTLVGIDYGTIDSHFHSGSATVSRMRAEKKVSFN
jgi:hypothetical protein